MEDQFHSFRIVFWFFVFGGMAWALYKFGKSASGGGGVAFFSFDAWAAIWRIITDIYRNFFPWSMILVGLVLTFLLSLLAIH